MNEVLNLINEMSPYLLLGFFFAGLLHVFVPGAVYSRYLSGHGFRSVLYAALLGVPLPLCSCGVLPTAMGLRKEGASKGATVAFLIATPETGVDSIAATYSLMGLPFAIVRPVVAFCTSLLAGTLVNRASAPAPASPVPSVPLAPERSEERRGVLPLSGELEEAEAEPEHSCCHHHHHAVDEETTQTPPQTLPREGVSPLGRFRGGRLLEALRYGFIDMMGDIGKWLVVGLVVAGLITVCVPDSFFEVFKDNTALSMLLVLCIAIPMYICATGSIPIAVALIMKGLTPGAALVLLMAGPACNMASLLVVGKKLGKKTLCLYLFSIILGAVVAGNIIDMMPREWFLPTLMQTACCTPEDTSWFNWTCTGILAILLLYSLIKHLNGEEHCCCCHEEAEHHEEGASCCCHGKEDAPKEPTMGSCCCHGANVAGDK